MPPLGVLLNVSVCTAFVPVTVLVPFSTRTPARDLIGAADAAGDVAVQDQVVAAGRVVDIEGAGAGAQRNGTGDRRRPAERIYRERVVERKRAAAQGDGPAGHVEAALGVIVAAPPVFTTDPSITINVLN